MKKLTKIKNWIKENWLFVIIFIVIYTFSIKFHVYYQLLIILVLLDLFYTINVYIKNYKWHQMQKKMAQNSRGSL